MFRWLIVPVALVSSVAVAQKLSSDQDRARRFFGVDLTDLGKYPECGSPAAAEKICVYKADGESTRSIELRPQRPEWMKTNILAETSNGQVVGAGVTTNGFVVQDDVLAYMKLRYGAPATLKRTGSANGFGEEFQIIHATWRTPDQHLIKFDGATDTLEEGEVRWLK